MLTNNYHIISLNYFYLRLNIKTFYNLRILINIDN
jgi:hypothetical protein